MSAQQASEAASRQGSERSGEVALESTVQILIEGVDVQAFIGPDDRLLTELVQQFPSLRVHLRGARLVLNGKPAQVRDAERVVRDLVALTHGGVAPTSSDVHTSSVLAKAQRPETAAGVLGAVILNAKGKLIRPKTVGQRDYVDAIESHTIVFGIGPAGTGKTYLAVAKAVQALQAKEVSKLILTRPAVEAGERLGYLPGSLEEKIDPYLRPLFDALNDMVEGETIPKLIESGAIEIAPLAYMRGRTLNNAFVILDEAQNTTPEQMKMFLTRLGFGSKMVVTGDVTQVDLPGGSSGLRHVSAILDGVDDIHFARLESADVVRHSLVGRIIDAYTSYDESQAAQVTSRGQSQGRSQTA